MSVNVSNYPQDFATADPSALEPVDSTLFLGVHPLLLLLLAALVIGLMILAWRAGKATAPTQADAAESIWRAVDRACQAAMTANSDGLEGATKALKARLTECLGAVFVLAEGPAKSMKAIDHALKGRIKEPAKPKDPPQAHGHGHGHGHCPPRPQPTCAPPPRPQPAQVNIVSSSVVIAADSLVCEVEPADAACRPDAAPPPHLPVAHPEAAKAEEKEVERDMTKAEQLTALREAVAQFNDYWCHREARIRELRAAHRQLSTRPAGPASGSIAAPSHH